MRVVVNLHNSAGVMVSRNLVPGNGLVFSVGMRSDYLIAKGQEFRFGISAQGVPDKTDPGDQLKDARSFAHVDMDSFHDFRNMPSEEPLYEILRRVIQHGLEYPRHGTGCVCMDAFATEIRRQLTTALGPQPITEADYERETPDEMYARMNAKTRVRYVLEMALRSM